MEQNEGTRPWVQLKEILEAGDSSRLEDYLEQLSSGDIARAISRLALSEQPRVLELLSADEAADLAEMLPETQLLELIQELPAETAASIMEKMQSNERADLLGTLEENGAAAILERMDPEVAREALQLAGYPADVAGGLMIKEYLSYPESAHVGHVLDDFRENAEEYSDYDIQYAYVITFEGRLVGVLPLRELLLAPPP